MRLIHGKLLYRYHNILSSKRKNYFNVSCIFSILTRINTQIIESETVFNKYVSDNNIDRSTFSIIKKNSKSDSKSDIESNSSNSASDLKITNSLRSNKIQKRIHSSPQNSNSLPLFNGIKSYETKLRENIKSEINLKSLDEYNSQLPSLIFFYNPQCPACVQTKPHWEKVKLKLNKLFVNGEKLFNIMEVNLADPSNENLATLFKIEYIPTIIMMESSDKSLAKIEKVEGMSDKNRIVTFIKESYAKFSN